MRELFAHVARQVFVSERVLARGGIHEQQGIGAFGHAFEHAIRIRAQQLADVLGVNAPAFGQ